MAMTTAEIQAKIDKLEINMNRLDEITNGNDTTDVTIDSGTVPTIAKFFKSLNDSVNGSVVAAQNAATAAAASAQAAQDSAASLNLPPITANTMMVDNPAGTAREAKTFSQVKSLLGLQRFFADSAALAAVSVPENTILVGNSIFQANTTGFYLDQSGKKFGPAWYVTPRMFGAIGDGMTDDRVACQNAWDYAGANKIICLMEGLKYNCGNSVFTSSNLTVHGQGAVMYITNYNAVGGFINNVRTVASERKQENIYIQDLITDGSKLPHYFQEFSNPLQANNLIQSQSNFDQSAWIKTNSSVTLNTAVGPYGGTIADRIVEDTATSTHLVSQGIAAVLTDQMMVYSVYVRGTGDRNVALSLSGAAFSSVFSVAVFDLTLNKVVSQSADLYVAEIQRVGDTGWSLVTIAKRTTAGGTYTTSVYMADAAGNRSYLGNGTSYIEACIAFSNVAAVGKNNNLGPEFAWGATNVRVVNCTARYCRVGIGGGTGGGGMGGELGLKDVVFQNCTIQDCYRGVRLAGNAVDTLSTGATEEAANVTFINTTIRNCGTAIFAHSVGHVGDDVSDIRYFDAVFQNTYIENCGHNPYSPVDWIARSTVGGPQKGGVIALGGAQNVSFYNTRVRLDATQVTTDVDWLGRSGYANANWATGKDGYFGGGLSGKVESIVGGWGQNCVFDRLTFDGGVTNIFNIHRVNIMGDLGSSAPTAVVPTETVRQFVIDNFRHVKTGTGIDYAFNCQSGVDNSRISIRLNLTRFNAFSGGVIGTNAAALTNVALCLLDNNGTSMTGTPAEWTAYGNATPSAPQRTFILGGQDFVGGYSPVGARRGLTISGTDGVFRQSSALATASTMQAFYNTNGLVGQIQCTASATAFVTSSDETLKDFDGEYEAEKAYEIIKALPVQKFTWKSDGSEAVGWGAQTAHNVSKDLGVLGYWFNPLNGEHCEEGDTWEVDSDKDGITEIITAQYIPAGIDQSKYTPYLWAATSKMIDEIEFLKNEIKKLKK